VLILYKNIQENNELYKLYIEKKPVLSMLAHSELARSILFIFVQAFFLVIPLFFYKKAIIKTYILRIKTTGSMDRRGILFFLANLFSMIIYIIICSAYSGPQDFPLFNLKYIIFWIRHIFILCFLAPFCEELLFRGIVQNEIKRCYNISPRLVIFYQACIFFAFHFLLSSNLPSVTFLLGIVTGIFAFYTDSLLYGLLYHMCYNLFILLTQTGIINLFELEISYFIIIPLTFLFFILNIFFIISFIKYIKRKISLAGNSTVL
jgi:membrane protease YdiL (CAAX protease family)